MASRALDAVLAALALPALAIDAQELIVAANAAAENLLGQGIRGRHFITALRQPALVEAVELCLQDNEPRQAQYLGGETNVGTTFDVHLHRPEAHVILTFQDISQMTQAGQMRRDFVANVSHELRTPLTALMGFIDTLRGPARDDPEAQQRFLAIMSGEADRMNRLVGDLLSLSRVEADERVRPRTTIDLVDVLRTTLRNMQPLASDSDVTLDPRFGDAPVMVRGDADQLQQVFTNLIENAIKYGGSGQSVDVETTLTDHDPGLRAPAVGITVRDQGPGIAAEHLPRLTERFYRVDDHRSRALGGTGLGLAIVKHILNRHRGRLKVRSEPGQGAEFTVSLPLDPGSTRA